MSHDYEIKTNRQLFVYLHISLSGKEKQDSLPQPYGIR